MHLNRRHFLGALAATTAASGAVVSGALAQSAPGNPTTGIGFDEVVAIARKPARHRQLFSSTRANGNVFIYIRNALNGYEFGWNEGPGTLHPVAVFNGLGVAQAVADAGWQRYRLGDVLAYAGAPLKMAANGNPWLHAPAGLAVDHAAQTAPFNGDVTIETLTRRGADWFVCDTAMITLAQTIVGAGAASDALAVHRDLRGLLVPGAHLVPSGVATIDALQGEHFTFYDANV